MQPSMNTFVCKQCHQSDDYNINESQVKASVVRDMLGVLETNYFTHHDPVVSFTSQEAN